MGATTLGSMMRTPGMSSAPARSAAVAGACAGTTFWMRSTRSSPKAALVAAMLRPMYFASSDFSEGPTFSDWISAGYTAPTTTAVTTSSATPVMGRRQLRLQMAARKNPAHITAATARMALVGSTALASV